MPNRSRENRENTIRAAKNLIEQYGENARDEAVKKAVYFAQKGDSGSEFDWNRIAQAITLLNNSNRR